MPVLGAGSMIEELRSWVTKACCGRVDVPGTEPNVAGDDAANAVDEDVEVRGTLAAGI